MKLTQAQIDAADRQTAPAGRLPGRGIELPLQWSRETAEAWARKYEWPEANRRRYRAAERRPA